MIRTARWAANTLFAVAASNVVLLACIGTYDVRLGPIHLVASLLFKPLLYLNAAFLLAFLLLREAPQRDAVSQPSANQQKLLTTPFVAAAVLLVAGIYGASLQVNLLHLEWTHRWLTSDLSASDFFIKPQYDGYYRPVAFLSLWLDNKLFGDQLWGYHLQSLLLHGLNGLLVARLAAKLGFNTATARWAGLLFLALPVGFEPAVAPGSRFDLLATACVLVALERALAGSLLWSTVAYGAGVLSKESAYCYPLLLSGLYLLQGPLRLHLDRKATLRMLAVAATLTVVLLGVRIAVYGDLGGYPDDRTGQKGVNFALSAKTFTSVPTRLPAVLYIVNSQAGLPLWLRAAVIAFVAALAAVLATRVRPTASAVLLALVLVSALPTLNVIGWINPAAQSSRYLYLPAVWIALSLASACMATRFGPPLATSLIVTMAAAALFNTLAYVRLQHTATSSAQQAATACRNATCCRTLLLRDVPGDLYGVIFLQDELLQQTRRLLPGVTVSLSGQPSSSDACTVQLQWSGANRWLVSTARP